MRNLNLDQLRALSEVSALGSFSAAAKRLHLSQPAISLQIRELENRFGVALLHRVGKRAIATAAGRELIAYARQLFDLSERAHAAMRRHKDGQVGRVRIGTGATSLIHLLPSVLRALRKSSPDIDIAVVTGTTGDITDRILADQIDIGLVTLPVDERVFTVKRLRSDRLIAILPADSTNVPARMKPADVAIAALILEDERANHSRLVRDWLRAAGLEPRPVMQLDNIEAIKTVVEAGLGMSIIPDRAVAARHDSRRFILRHLTPPLRHSLALVHRRDRAPDEAAMIVMRALRSLAR